MQQTEKWKWNNQQVDLHAEKIHRTAKGDGNIYYINYVKLKNSRLFF